MSKLNSFLFIFAHPDDETIGCGGTIAQLVAAGHEVTLLSVTDGGAGEVMAPAQQLLAELGSVSQVRRNELASVSTHLGVKQHYYLEYEDGKITNDQVWGKLKEDIITIIDREKPDVVVTFDHTGWYFHLDHVGISIATTWAVKESIHRVPFFLLSQMRVTGSKWEYLYPPLVPSHFVAVDDTRSKLKAIDLHQSQDLDTVKNFINSEPLHREWYQLAVATQPVAVLEKSGIFQPVTDPSFQIK